MRVKFIVHVLIIVLVTVLTYNIVYADNETKVETSVNIDESKNIIITVKTNNIELFEAVLDYDSDVIKYEGIEVKNNWEIKQDENELNISIVSNNSNNNEEKDIAVLRFKPINIENIDETSISFTNIKVGKQNDEREDLEDLNIIAVLNEEDDSNEEEASEDSFIPDGTEENEEEINKQLEGDMQEESQEDLDNNEEIYEEYSEVIKADEEKDDIDEAENVEENGQSGEIESGNDDYKEENSIEEENSISNEEEKKDDKQKEKDNLANKILPQTGLVLMIAPAILAIGAAIMSIFWFKKYRNI